mgnify:FL=1
MEIGFFKEFSTSFDQVESSLRTSLADQGFGVITEIDVQETMRAKLGKEYPPYKILGACNPPVAYEALTRNQDIGLMLPCNVIIHEQPSGKVRVGVVNPAMMMSMTDEPGMENMADDIKSRLITALESV